MSLTVAILMMIVAWLLVAVAMLWGVLRIARRHYVAPAPRKQERPVARKIHAPGRFA
jgi:hypothetical protein